MSSEEDSEFPLYSDKLLKKPKRTRQRVDAGEPRNSYSSIPNFSSRPNFFPNTTNYYNNYFVHPPTHHTHSHNPTQHGSHQTQHSFHSHQQQTQLQSQLQPQHQQQHQQQQYFNLFCAQSYTTSVPPVLSHTGLSSSNANLAPKMLNEILCNRLPPPPPKSTNSMMQSVAQTVSLEHTTNSDSVNNNNNNNNNNNKYDCSSIINENQVVNRANISRPSSPSSNLVPNTNQEFANHMLRDILQNRKHEFLNFEQEFRKNNLINNNNNNDIMVKHEVPANGSSQTIVQNDSVNEIVQDIILNNSMLATRSETNSPKKCENNEKTTTEEENNANSVLEVTNPKLQSPKKQPSLSLSPPTQPVSTASTIVAPLALLTQSQTPIVNGCKKRKLYQPQQHADKYIRLSKDEDDMSDDCEDQEVLSTATNVRSDICGEMDREKDEGNYSNGDNDIDAEIDNDDDIVDDNDEDDEDNDEEQFEQIKLKKLEKSVLKSQLRTMQEQLVDMQQKYVQLCTKIDKEKGDEENTEDQNQSGDEKNFASNENSPAERVESDRSPPVAMNNRLNGLFNNSNQNPMAAAAAAAMYLGHKLFLDQEAKMQIARESLRNDASTDDSNRKTPTNEKSSYLLELESLANTLKSEITSSLSSMIDSIVSRYLSQKRLRIQNPEVVPNDNASNRGVNMLDRAQDKSTTPSSQKQPLNGSFHTMLQNLKMHHHQQQQQQQQHQQQQQQQKQQHLQLHQNRQQSPTQSEQNNHIRSTLPFLASQKQQQQQSLINPAAAAAAALYAMNQHNLCLQQQQHQQQQQQNSNSHVSTSMSSNISQSLFHDSKNCDSSEQSEALSLVMVPKKKRHKVTDTRITPRTVSRILAQENLKSEQSNGNNGCTSPRPTSLYQQPHHGHHFLAAANSNISSQSILPSSLPTSVAIPNPQLHESQVFSPYSPYFHANSHNISAQASSSPPRIKTDPELSPLPHPTSLLHPALLAAAHHRASPDFKHMKPNLSLFDSYDHNSDCNSPDLSFDGAHSSTLTPMHLRKAKLMFFWVRYPSSSVLKMYFPDIKFNKNNTAQLVKWFSNFREFYYIQMEKYARQAVSEGIKNVEEINVATDSEIYRVLNLHYNRNNHIEVCDPQVPSNFRFVVEQTLREFFRAISTGKDTEQSWKKSIYKVISRLDDSVPEYFKSPNFLEQLE